MTDFEYFTRLLAALEGLPETHFDYPVIDDTQERLMCATARRNAEAIVGIVCDAHTIKHGDLPPQDWSHPRRPIHWHPSALGAWDGFPEIEDITRSRMGGFFIVDIGSGSDTFTIEVPEIFMLHAGEIDDAYLGRVKDWIGREQEAYHKTLLKAEADRKSINTDAALKSAMAIIEASGFKVVRP